MKPFFYNICILALLSTLFFFLSPFVYATGTQKTGYQVPNNGIAVEIDVYNNCKRVTNTHSSNAIFVPTASEAEWNTFLASAPAYISIDDCVSSAPFISTWKSDNP